MNQFQDLLKNKKLLIFDFDGTIANTSIFHEQAFKEVLINYNINFFYQDIAGLSSADAFQKIFLENNILISNKELSDLVRQKQYIARNLISNYLEPSEGLSDFLIWAVNSFKICIVSSGSSLSIMNALQKIKLEKFFNKIICAEDVQNTKPDPEGFIKALETFSISPEEAIIFEDSDSGFKAADRAGVIYLDVNSFSWTDLYTKNL